MTQNLNAIASAFVLDGSVTSVKPLGEGFINDTFIVETSNNVRYILQRKNKKIFTNIPSMMDNILRVTNHLKNKIIASGGDPLREAMTIIPTTNGELYFKDSTNEYWAVCLFIEDTIAYQSATTPELASQGGRGIGKFQAMLSDFKEPLVNILPGFHDMRFRFTQFDQAVAADAAGRVRNLTEEISWINARRDKIMEVWEKVENGTIPTRVTHNDTKINNILFDQQGEVLCVIDLDTVLSSTILNDYGDAMRSYTNTGAEDDADLSKVSMDINIFRGFTEGYLSQASKFLSPEELKYLAFSAIYITYEQVLRFLLDYINGDTYYKIKSPDHNLIRTRAQYKLLQSMEAQLDEMNKIVAECHVRNS
ncbi:MAG: aminoglycoside phosphotransferase family protein [Mucinivorans sp.]